MRTPGGVDGAQVHTWISANRPDLVDKVVIITGDYANEEQFRPCARLALFIWKSLSAYRILSLPWRRPWGKPVEYCVD